MGALKFQPNSQGTPMTKNLVVAGSRSGREQVVTNPVKPHE